MKVLYVTNLINSGGVARVVLSYIEGCCSLNSDFSCDLVAYEEPNELIKIKLKKYGVNTYCLPRPTRNLLNYTKRLNDVLDNGYDAIHTHIEYFNWIPCMIAKKRNVAVTVGHAHGQKGKKENLIHHIIQCIGRKYNSKFCDFRVACSEPSGNFVFGGNFDFLPNFINTDNIITIDEKNILKYNKEFGISKNREKILGYMGYLGFQKNPKLALEFVKKLHEKDASIVLLMAGDGIQEKELKQFISDNKMESYAFLIGQREDNILLMQYFDYLLMPSFSEGMSIALIEAQIMGTPCLVSPGVPGNNDLDMDLFFKAKELNVNSFLMAFNEMVNTEKKYSYEERVKILKSNCADKEGVITRLLMMYRGETINGEN